MKNAMSTKKMATLRKTKAKMKKLNVRTEGILNWLRWSITQNQKMMCLEKNHKIRGKSKFIFIKQNS